MVIADSIEEAKARVDRIAQSRAGAARTDRRLEEAPPGAARGTAGEGPGFSGSGRALWRAIDCPRRRHVRPIRNGTGNARDAQREEG